MNGNDFARALVSMPRSTRAIGLAFLEASTNMDAAADAETATKIVTRAIAKHEAQIDALAIPHLITALVALFAAKTDTAPKQALEQLWKDAPTDQWWQDHVRPTTRGDTE